MLEPHPRPLAAAEQQNQATVVASTHKTDIWGVVFVCFLLAWTATDHSTRLPNLPVAAKEGRDMPESQVSLGPQRAPLYLMLISNFQSL